MKRAIVIVLLTFVVLGGCLRRVDDIREVAPEYFASFGYEIDGFIGWTRSLHDGGRVWYIIEKDGVEYYASLRMRYTGEMNLWSIEPIRPTTGVLDVREADSTDDDE